MRVLVARLGWVVLVVGLGGCASRGDVGAAVDGTHGAARHDFAIAAAQAWRIVEVSGAAIDPSDAVLELHFDAATAAVSGRSGVNAFSGTFACDGASLRFGPLAVTRMAGPPARMALESKVLAALEATRRWSLGARELVLLDAAGASVARCEPLVR